MPVAAFTVVTNIALAGLLSASYATIAFLHPTQRAPVWFAASYAVIMLAPIAQLGLASGVWTGFFGAMVFFTFAGALILMVPALAVFYGQPVPWRLIWVLAGVTILAAASLPRLDLHSLRFAEIYQSPFLFAMLACVWMVLKHSPRRANDLVLAGMLALTAAHFPIKAAVSAHFGTGVNPANSMESPYALLSQVSTGLLLVATGLILLVNTGLVAVRDSAAAAERDPLSRIFNRRGFEEHGERLMAQSRRRGTPTALLLLDLDDFKSINDTFGHACGDRAIRWFAALLDETTPQSAVVGRLGGEEFGVLLERSTRETARLQAEAIRAATLSGGEDDVPPMTVSIGVTDMRAADTLHMMQDRADAALYEAKHAGRNRVVLAPPGQEATRADNVITLRRRDV